MTLIDSVLDYAKTQESFTVGDVSSALKANPDLVKTALWRLVDRDEIERCGKQGKRAVYRVKEQTCQTDSRRETWKPKRLWSRLSSLMTRR